MIDFSRGHNTTAQSFMGVSRTELIGTDELVTLKKLLFSSEERQKEKKQDSASSGKSRADKNDPTAAASLFHRLRRE
jgi:hypothetical protein